MNQFLHVGSNKEPICLAQPVVMGILNTTPDSFSDGGLYQHAQAALDHARRMLEEGALIIDVGGESTRPGAKAVSESEELDRVLPVVEALKKLNCYVSVDTSSPKVMSECMKASACIWNDTRGFSKDGALDLAASSKVGLILMHRRGESTTMDALTQYQDVVTDVKSELEHRLGLLTERGVELNRVALDVGFGFAKTHEQNFELLSRLEAFNALGCVQLIGLSKKRMLAHALEQAGLPTDLNNRTDPGVAAAVIAVQKGVKIIRTHDVGPTVRALSVFNCLP